ncbi:hypothetical protein PN498_01645 [Oscillatoria sp. CS-180]|uniref:hypothetical protein n=1 Tax=Oscillatoria sp. CS-180 TaxID=3021720 RepID=UPI00232CB41B|nr:hypothetical protein [Oscillatoria sp. CS-180]MDB9524678.1 hypothetical protein [Oscillatoria sp. CS-180]
MKKLAVGLVLLGGLGVILGVGLATGSVRSRQQETTFTGNVQQVWEDGLRLETSDRILRVDTWEVCGDNTVQYVAEGDIVTLTGEFEGNEFDAFSLTSANDEQVCR